MTQNIQDSLGNISLIMSDGFKFCNIRFPLEEIEKRAANGCKASQELIDVVFTFERLICFIGKEECSNVKNIS